MIKEKNIDIKEAILNIYDNKKGLNNCTIEITNSCIFKCPHCYMPNSKKKFMDMKEYEMILSQLSSLGCMWLLLTGGETLMHPNFKEMYLMAKNMGFFVSINTNGYLINDELIELFKTYKPYVIEISLYGYEENTYYNFTKIKDSYEKVNNNINKLIENNINLSLKSILTKKTADYIFKLKEYAKQKNVPFRYDYIVFPKVNQDSTKENYERLSPNSIIEILKQDKEAITHFENKTNELLNKEINSDFIFECTGGEDAIYIDAYGNINMCVVMQNNKYNINNYTISKAIEEFKKIKCQKLPQNSKCKSCYKKSICRYCPARFYLETGSYSKEATWYCNMADSLIKEFYKTYQYDYKTLTDIMLKDMFEIIYMNMSKINPITGNKSDIYKTWKDNILSNKSLTTCILKDKNVYAYIQYILKENECCICEIEIEEKYQHDHKTFKELLKKLIINANINQNSIIYGNINPNNKHSIEVFTNIGFKNIKNNRYEIDGLSLITWINSK